MTDYEFKIFCFKVWKRASDIMPRRPEPVGGNLSRKSFKREINGDTCEFYIDLSIAPYGEYLEDGTGRGSAKHKGFFERCLTEAIKTIAVEYSARVEEL